jgi:hypothetical protein
MTEPIVSVKPGGEINPWWQQVVSTVRADGAMNVERTCNLPSTGTAVWSPILRPSSR